MFVQGWVRIGTDGEVSQLAKTWFDAMVSTLPDGRWGQVLAAGGAAERTPNGIWGDRLRPYGELLLWGRRGQSSKFLRPGIWPPPFEKLGDSLWSVEIALGQFDGQGFDAHAVGDVRGNAQREMPANDPLRPWMSFLAESSPPWSGGECVGWRRAWPVEVLREAVREIAVEFAMAGRSSAMVFDDSREAAWLPRVREVLPTYDWVTVASSDVVARLGGVQALQASGAFWLVEEVAGGSVWLQATADLEQFDTAHGMAVFETLAKCLPGRVICRPELEDYGHPYAAYGRAGLGVDVNALSDGG